MQSVDSSESCSLLVIAAAALVDSYNPELVSLASLALFDYLRAKAFAYLVRLERTLQVLLVRGQRYSLE